MEADYIGRRVDHGASKCAKIVDIQMYSTVLLLHSWLRWLAVAGGVGSTYAALGKDTSAIQRAERWGLVFMIALDLQLLLGLLLYGWLSPITAQTMQDMGGAMRNPVLRFWAVEHVTAMLVAVILVHVGRVLARKTPDLEARRTRLLICFGAATLIMLAGIPWPGLANARPLFRF